MNKRSKKQSLREVVPHTPVSVNVGEVVVDVADEFRNLLVKGGLAIASALFTEEVTKLCGPRYARGDELANRWGHAKGDVVLGGRRAKLTRPRVRRNGEEVELESFAQLQREDPLDDRAVEQMLVGVSTRKYTRSLEPVIPDVATFGTSKSAVSRRFVAKTSPLFRNDPGLLSRIGPPGHSNSAVLTLIAVSLLRPRQCSRTSLGQLTPAEANRQGT